VKAIRVDAVGGPEALHHVEVPVPDPGPDQALVRLAAIGINFIDTYHRSGLYKLPLPFIPGSEAAGTIVATGAAVRDLGPGDRVAYAMVPGAYAEYAAVPAAKLVRIPDGVTFADAAALMLQGMTAQYLTTSTFALARGDSALVHAGAGGVGLLLTQRAKTIGATVISTVSSEEKAALSRAAGADHVIRYDVLDVPAEVRRLTSGRGVDVVYDGVGKATFEGSLDALRPRGMLALFGASSGPVPPFDLARLAQKGSLFVTRPTLGDYVATSDELRRRATDVFEAVASGTLRLRVEHVYPLADAARAHEDLERRRTTGKLLLIPPNETTP
jgi:NADPH2:quinone reductase